MKSSELRDRFLKFFERHGHTIVPSSPLIPANDPTLLFTNAGMVQFKDVFVGAEKRPYVRAASSQRCVRAGGKHNDLENVGYTARHHTFFEMLGNFSFGDYFKREAIAYAWEFLTRELKLPAERLWITIYQDDDEAANNWLNEIGVDSTRFTRLGESSNFWAMGDTGPCGPCSEIFYDHGPGIAGGPPGSPDEDGDRYVEIWNLVFMQYNRDAGGKLHPLPKPSVDTGMGLERISAVMQGVHSNYDIDIFQDLIQTLRMFLPQDKRGTAEPGSLKAIVDHIRATSFLILDGVLPSNEGRGYVLRRIMRRAIRHGSRLGIKEPFFHKLVGPLALVMGGAYPELNDKKDEIGKVILQEEEGFAETLSKGLRILEEAIGGARNKTLGGDVVFKLYDTYGFPADLTADIARERGLTLDMEGFEREMQAQRTRAREASTFKSAAVVSLDELGIRPATFTGYESIKDQAKISALLCEGVAVQELKAGQNGVVYLDTTPFYAESGGQVGDQGLLIAGDARFQVQDTQKGHAHVGQMLQGRLKVGDSVRVEVDQVRRQATAYNHSATHLLHAALKKVLGPHVSQKGSLVDAERLRFDFTQPEPVTRAQLDEIERLVNDEIRANDPVETRVMPIAEAMASGAMALFGEKYGDEVRVVGMGEFSTELCGGTHVRRTGDIGLLKIVAEGGVAAGVRRIEAVTAAGALAYARDSEQRLARIADLVRGSRDDVERKVEQLGSRVKSLEKELDQLRGKMAASKGDALLDAVRVVKGVKVLATRLDGADSKGLRETLDRLKDKLGSAAIVLASVQDNKVTLIAGVTKDLVGRIHAGEMVNQVAMRVGGKGGGRPDMAQAGGTDPSQLDAALAAIPAWVEKLP